MITLYNGYVITNDELQWTLAKDDGQVDKRTGKTKYKPIGYFSSLEEAFGEFRRRNIRSAMQDASLSLCEALLVIKNENERLENFIKENIPGKEA